MGELTKVILKCIYEEYFRKKQQQDMSIRSHHSDLYNSTARLEIYVLNYTSAADFSQNTVLYLAGGYISHPMGCFCFVFHHNKLNFLLGFVINCAKFSSAIRKKYNLWQRMFLQSHHITLFSSKMASFLFQPKPMVKV